jgi:monoamine oxidase
METIVIGGGIAGLYAGLDRPNTLVLEASDRLGGRIYTRHEPQYEIGAGRIHAKHGIVRGLIRRFGLTEVPLKRSPTDEHLLRTLPLKRTEAMRNVTYAQYCRNQCRKKTCKRTIRAEVERLRQEFGYYSEFEVMNAYDAADMLQRALSGSFVVVKEGLSELVKRMAVHVNYKLNHKVQSVEVTPDGVVVDGIKAKRVIFAIPPKALAHFHVLPPATLNAVAPLPLLRVYAAYDRPWAAGLNAETTTSWLRHIIPISPTVVMVAYVEGEDTAPFRTQSGKLRSQDRLNKEVHEELRRVFPEREIPDPIHFKAYLWTEGGHAWLPRVNSDEIAQAVLHPRPSVYVCGEAFSHKQAWVEGALETTAQVLKMIS